MGGVRFVLSVKSSVLPLDLWNFPPSERTTNDWNLRSLGLSNHLLFKASASCVHVCILNPTSSFQDVPSISSQIATPNLTWEVRSIRRTRTRERSTIVASIRWRLLPCCWQRLDHQSPQVDKDSIRSELSVAKQLASKFRTCLLQQSFWPVFKKLHWRNWNLSGNLKPGYSRLSFFQPGSNRPKWQMWTTCGSWAPKIRRIKEPALLPSLWQLQVLPQSRSADQRCQAQWHWQGEGEIRGALFLNTRFGKMKQVTHDDTWWHMRTSCLHIFDARSHPFFMVIWNLTCGKICTLQNASLENSLLARLPSLSAVMMAMSAYHLVM